MTNARRDRREAALRSLATWVAENLDGDLRVATLARQAGMSPSRLSHWFREQMGTTPHAFVIAARIERAKALLRDSSLSLVEIAFAVGFSSQSCLNVAFCQNVNMTPSQYRSRFGKKTKDGAVRRASSSRRSVAEPDRRKRGARA